MRPTSVSAPLVFLALAACGESTAPEPTPPRPAGLQLSETSLVLSPQEFHVVSAAVRDADGELLPAAEVAWQSSAPDVATVSTEGRIDALAPGRLTITATADTADATLQLDVVTSFVEIAAGNTATCGRTPDGAAYCWGSNRWGHLGIGTSGGSVVEPAAVIGGLVWKSLSMGVSSACGVTTSDAAWCWGNNYIGGGGSLLGQPDPSDLSPVPLAVPDGHLFAEVTVGRETVCGVTVSGGGLCWGRGAYGRLGTGNETSQHYPTPVVGDHAFSLIRLGQSSGCGLVADGSAWCWGSIAATGDETMVEPVPVPGGHHFVDLATAFATACGLTAAGETWCWGQNSYGILPDDVGGRITTPVRVADGFAFTALALGGGLGDQMCALTADGRAWCWGSNSHGQLGAASSDVCVLGNVSRPCSRTPLAVSGDHRFVGLYAGESHTCGVTAGGAAWCWGRGVEGQLGNGAMENSAIPARVAHPVPLTPDIATAP